MNEGAFDRDARPPPLLFSFSKAFFSKSFRCFFLFYENIPVDSPGDYSFATVDRGVALAGLACFLSCEVTEGLAALGFIYPNLKISFFSKFLI